MLLKKTLEVSVSKFEELCKTDARMETLKTYISNEENGYIKLDTVKAIIGLPVKHEEPSVWEHEELSFDELGITQHRMHKRLADNYNVEEMKNGRTEI